MNFSVKSVLKRRHNYLIPFLFIFCARCIYKSSYTPPSHPPKHTPTMGTGGTLKNLRHQRIENRRPKGDLSSGPTDQREVKPNLRDPFKFQAAQVAKKSV